MASVARESVCAESGGGVLVLDHGAGVGGWSKLAQGACREDPGRGWLVMRRGRLGVWRRRGEDEEECRIPGERDG